MFVRMILTVCLLVSVGCGTPPRDSEFDDASKYFDNALSIQLCEALSTGSKEHVRKAVDAGADVNTVGKHGATPLLWALGFENLECFELLGSLGADPNIEIEEPIGRHTQIKAGMSVTQLSAVIKEPGYFESVMKNGGKVDLLNTHGESLLHLVIQSRASAEIKRKRISELIKRGANLDHVSSLNWTPAMFAATRGCQYDIVLQLLEAGASPDVYQDRTNKQLIHIIVQTYASLPPEIDKSAEYGKMIASLESRGFSATRAHADLERWKTWASERSSKEYRRLLDEEIAARKKNELEQRDDRRVPKQ